MYDAGGHMSILIMLADVYVGNHEQRPFDLHGETLILAPRWEVDGEEWHGIRVLRRAGTPP